jgi:hypothetical protein
MKQCTSAKGALSLFAASNGTSIVDDLDEDNLPRLDLTLESLWSLVATASTLGGECPVVVVTMTSAVSDRRSFVLDVIDFFLGVLPRLG